MYEHISLTEKVSYIESPAKIGIIRISDKEAVLIDSGSDKDAGKKALRALEAAGLSLSAIYNTHSHADHIGGNRFLSERTGCEIYAHGIERDFTVHPILEPMFLYGGFPPESLKHKFILAQESPAKEMTKNILPAGVELLPLPGHSFDMVGFRCEDVVFLADCLSSAETLEKYGIGFLYDVGAYLDTLEKVKDLEAKLFVPSHAAVTDNIAPLAEYNIRAVKEAAERITTFCTEPSGFDTLLEKLFRSYNMTMSAQQYVLIGSTLRSYLSYLVSAGAVEAFTDNCRMLWKKL